MATPSDSTEEQLEMQQLLLYLKTLADQTRLRLLGLLATEKRSVEELATLLGLKPSTVSWHLGRLKEIGLVDMKSDGNTHVYRMNGRGLGRINSLLARPEKAAILNEIEMDAWERKVLSDFLQDGKLRDIPAYRRKRQIILRWLREQFEYGRTYTEKDVNQILARYHDDTATLRRELIGEKHMARERGIYWRLEPSHAGPSKSPTAEASENSRPTL
jgi:DNA-binding CsgD family transcriptional regulator